MTPLALYTASLLTWMALTIVVADIIKSAYRHYNKGNEFHPEPFPLHWAVLVAIVEVCYDKPLALHRSRMEVVRRCEQRRAEARHESVQDAMLRHPSNHRARQACKAAHPSIRSTPAHGSISARTAVSAVSAGHIA